MSKTHRWMAFVVGAGLIAGACGDPASTGDPLGDTAAQELADAVVGSGFEVLGGAAFQRVGPQAAPGINLAPAVTGAITIDDSGPCDGGGTAAVKGSLSYNVNDQGTQGSLTFDVTQSATKCVVSTETQGDFTLSGDPNIHTKGTFNFSTAGTTETLTGKLTYDGGVSWESADGQAGTCGVDLTANFDVSVDTGTGAGTGSASLTGTFCGVSINRTVDVS